MEQWKSIPGWENYEASDCQQIRNAKTKKLLYQETMKPKPYKRVILWRKNKPIKLLAHRLIAFAWVPNPDPKNKTKVNHKDNVEFHNWPFNLEWTSQKENVHHAIKIGAYNPSKNGYFGHLKRWNFIKP